MKNILLTSATTLVILFSSFGLYAQDGVKWEKSSFEQIVRKAQKSDKMIFMDCYTSWCAPCKWMSQNVFPTKTAGDYLNGKFICTQIDMEKGEGVDLRTLYNIRAYPTFLVLDKKGEELGRIVGKNDVDEFIANIEILIDPNNSPQRLEDKIKESGDITYAYKYVSVMTALNQHDNTGYIFNKYWNDLEPYCKYYHQNVQYFKRAIDLTNPVVFNDILNNKTEYDSHFGKAVIDQILVEGLTEQLAYFFSAPTMYNKETVKPEVMEKAYTVISLIASNDYYAQFLSSAVKAKLTGDTNELTKALDVNKMTSNLNPRQLSHIRMLLNELTLTETEKAKFIRDLRNFYQDQLKSTDSDWEKYKNVVLPNNG